MGRVYIYSDESSQKGTDAAFVVAGVAVAEYHNVIWRALLEVEQETNKGTRDWHRTKEPKTRRRYLEAALAIPQLEGRIFYRAHEPRPGDLWRATIDTLGAAVRHFAEGELSVLAHEGFTAANRARLKQAVMRSGAADKVEVATGKFDANPVIRLADSLAGFLRLLLVDPQRADRFADLKHEWFVELKENPPS